MVSNYTFFPPNSKASNCNRRSAQDPRLFLRTFRRVFFFPFFSFFWRIRLLRPLPKKHNGGLGLSNFATLLHGCVFHVTCGSYLRILLVFRFRELCFWWNLGYVSSSARWDDADQGHYSVSPANICFPPNKKKCMITTLDG